MVWKPPVYFINLDKSKNRRLDLVKQLSRMGVKPTRIQAIDGRETDQLSKYKIDRSWKCFTTTDVQYGVTLSHLLAIARAYRNDHDVALILEDDMMVLRLPTKRLIDAAPADWDILQLSVTGGKATRLYAGQFQYFTRWKTAFTHSGAYLINKRGMVKILYSMAPQVLRKEDLALVTFRGANIRLSPVPLLTSSCVADYILYKLTNTYAVGDISMIEDRRHTSTILPDIKYIPHQDDVADFVKALYAKRGFLMKW